MMYSADVTGVSSSMLANQRSVISFAASAPGAGKNPMPSLWMDDCANMKLDPAFAAHAMPLAKYARACYENWLPGDILQDTFSEK